MLTTNDVNCFEKTGFRFDRFLAIGLKPPRFKRNQQTRFAKNRAKTCFFSDFYCCTRFIKIYKYVYKSEPKKNRINLNDPDRIYKFSQAFFCSKIEEIFFYFTATKTGLWKRQNRVSGLTDRFLTTLLATLKQLQNYTVSRR